MRFAVDEVLRDTSTKALGGLQPVARADGIHTAGNSSQIADGASAILLVAAETADGLGVRPRARVLQVPEEIPDHDPHRQGDDGGERHEPPAQRDAPVGVDDTTVRGERGHGHDVVRRRDERGSAHELVAVGHGVGVERGDALDREAVAAARTGDSALPFR